MHTRSSSRPQRRLMLSIVMAGLIVLSGCISRDAASMDRAQPVTLVNSVEVAPAQEGAFVHYWSLINDVLKDEPGYISSQLLKSTDSEQLSTNGETEFPLVAVIVFETEPLFWAAVSKGWERHGRPEFEGVTLHPGLYTVIR